MPQTSPMSWMMTSLMTMGMLMSISCIMNNFTETKASKNLKKMNSKTLKWSW